MAGDRATFQRQRFHALHHPTDLSGSQHSAHVTKLIPNDPAAAFGRPDSFHFRQQISEDFTRLRVFLSAANPHPPMKLTTLLALLVLPITLLAQAGKPEAGGEKRKADPSLAPVTDTPGLPRVLLIGDSISMGYTVPVRELLAGKANLHRIPQNGGSTQTGLDNFDKWIGSAKWDVIHFNWGLHDLKHWANNKMDNAAPPVAAVEVYEKNLRDLVARLKKTGAKLIWANTTPVPEGTAGRLAGDEKKYNEVAARVMKDAGVPTDDLHSAVVANPTWQREKNVHFTPEGSKALAEKVVAAITAQLPKK